MKKILMGLLLMLLMVSSAMASKIQAVISHEDLLIISDPTYKMPNITTNDNSFPKKKYEHEIIVHPKEINPNYNTIFTLATLNLLSYNESTGDFVYKLSLSNFAFSQTYMTNLKDYIPKHTSFTFDESKKNYVMISGRYDKKNNNFINIKNNHALSIVTNGGAFVKLDTDSKIPLTITYD